MEAKPLSREEIKQFVMNFKPSPGGRKFFVCCLNGEIHVGKDLAILGRAFRKYLGFIDIHGTWATLCLNEISGIGIFEPTPAPASRA